jgi:hypothetical protein
MKIAIFFPTKESGMNNVFMDLNLPGYYPDVNREDLSVLMIFYKLEFICKFMGVKKYYIIKK